jgi:NADPH2:quinone reductase
MKKSIASRTTLPSTMKAAAVDRFGGPSLLKTHTLPVREPGPGEVLIALHAAGVGGWDADIRKGNWRAPGRVRFPLIPGLDGAGIVVARGQGVRRLKVGDRVLAYEFGNPKGGFYAEYTVVRAADAARIPKGLDFLEAATAAATGVTALQGIDDALRLRRGETILIFGATGAVGTLAVQFARRRKARVIATSSDTAGRRLVKKLGADAVFDARRDGAVEQVRKFAPDGLDAALVFAGGDDLEKCLDLLRPGGRVAYPKGVNPEPRPRKGIRRLAYDGTAGPREFARFARAVADAKLQVPIDKVYALAHARRAHERLERGRILGRMVLRMLRAGQR